MPQEAEEAVARRKQSRSRSSIIEMLDTRPAQVAAPLSPMAADEIPDEELGWEPQRLPRAVRSRRTYRIPVIVLTLLAAAALYAIGHFAIRLPQAEADGRRGDYAATLEAAASEIAGLRVAAATITDVSFDGDLTEPLPALIGAGHAATDLRAAVESTRLPRLPGVPYEDLDSLEPLEDRMAAIADRLDGITDVLTDTAVYRRSMEDMFLLPELPGPDEGPSVEVFSDRLAQMTSTTVTAASLLPDGPLFAGHREQVGGLLDWLPDWQAAYLEALRSDHLDAADSLREEAAAKIQSLRDHLAAPLAEAARWVEAELVRLEWDIEAALTLSG